MCILLIKLYAILKAFSNKFRMRKLRIKVERNTYRNLFCFSWRASTKIFRAVRVLRITTTKVVIFRGEDFRELQERKYIDYRTFSSTRVTTTSLKVSLYECFIIVFILNFSNLFPSYKCWPNFHFSTLFFSLQWRFSGCDNRWNKYLSCQYLFKLFFIMALPKK